MNYKNRGMFLESIINKTIKLYFENDVALFHKKHIPITFAGITKEGQKSKLTSGWIASKSTTDYYGIYQGIFTTFEAKSTNLVSLPLTNIKLHQQEYLKKIALHGGISFYIVAYNKFNKYYLIPWYEIEKIPNKSLNIEVAKNVGYELDFVYPGILDFAFLLLKIKHKKYLV